jgi:hypothetical protein
MSDLVHEEIIIMISMEAIKIAGEKDQTDHDMNRVIEADMTMSQDRDEILALVEIILGTNQYKSIIMATVETVTETMITGTPMTTTTTTTTTTITTIIGEETTMILNTAITIQIVIIGATIMLMNPTTIVKIDKTMAIINTGFLITHHLR